MVEISPIPKNATTLLTKSGFRPSDIFKASRKSIHDLLESFEPICGRTVTAPEFQYSSMIELQISNDGEIDIFGRNQSK